MGHSILKQFIANSPCSEAGRGRGPPKGSTGGPSSTRGHYYKRTTEFQIGRISELRGGQGSTGPTRGVHWPNSGGPQALHRGRRARAKPAIRTAEAGSGVTDPRRLRNAVREPRGDSNCILLIKKECFVRMSLKATAPPLPVRPQGPKRGSHPPPNGSHRSKENKIKFHRLQSKRLLRASDLQAQRQPFQWFFYGTEDEAKIFVSKRCSLTDQVGVFVTG